MKSMVIKAASALHVAMAILLAPAVADAQCQFKRIAQFDLTMDHGDPLVPVTVNDKQGYLLFSNRSNVTALYKDAAEGLRLELYPTNNITNHGGKAKPVYGVHIHDLRVGGMASIPADLFVVTRDRPSALPIWGVLTTSGFIGDAVEFDYPKKQINIYSEKYCEGRLQPFLDAHAKAVPLQRQDLATVAAVNVDGTALPAVINSSHQFTALNYSAVKLANLTLEDDPNGVDADHPSPGFTGKVAVIHKLEIAGEIFQDVRIRIENTETGPAIPGASPLGSSRTYDMTDPKIILGVDYLLSHNVVISPTQHLAFVSSTGANPFAATGWRVQDSARKP